MNLKNNRYLLTLEFAFYILCSIGGLAYVKAAHQLPGSQNFFSNPSDYINMFGICGLISLATRFLLDKWRQE
jgi:hypothetical protein